MKYLLTLMPLVMFFNLAGAPSATAQNSWMASRLQGEEKTSVLNCSDGGEGDSWLCLVVRCEADRTFGVYGDVSAGSLTGPFSLVIDDKVFAVRGGPSASGSRYATRLDGDSHGIVTALKSGRAVTIDHPQVPTDSGFNVIALRGSGKAIAKLENSCALKMPQPVSAPTTGQEPVGITELSGLNKSRNCAFAKVQGTVGEVKLVSDGAMIEGFWYDSEFGKSYANVDEIPAGTPGSAADRTRNGLKALIRKGNKVEIGVHGCGAGGRIEKLVSVKLLESAALPQNMPPAASAVPVAAAESKPLDIGASEVDPLSANARGVALNRSAREAEGFELIRQAADAGDVRALANMGALLREGAGTPKNMKAAIDALRRAADAGDPFATLELGLSYQSGTGVLPSRETAYSLWVPILDSIAGPEVKFHASQGMDWPGKSSAEKLETSYRLCMEAAEQGHRPALFYCNDYSNASADWNRKLRAVERAVSRRPWTTGLNLERAYVKEFFTDNDDKLRWLLGYSIPAINDELKIDLAKRVKDLGFPLD